jgi:hypothetical protein
MKIITKTKHAIIGFSIIGLIYFIFQFHSENEKIQIINSIMKDTNFDQKNISEFNDNIDFNIEYLENFDLLDKPSIFSQLLMSDFKRIVNYKSKSINSKQHVKNEFFNYSISKPIISYNSDIVLIQITENCDNLCGECSVYIFEKINGKWRIKQKILVWTS